MPQIVRAVERDALGATGAADRGSAPLTQAVKTPKVGCAMRQQPVVVQLQRQEDAECVARALAEHASTFEAQLKGWNVHVDIRSRSLGDVLSALHECMVENEIPLVRLKIDDRTYVMEPAATE